MSELLAPDVCHACPNSVGLHDWQCPVCGGRLCSECEEEQSASHHRIYKDRDSGESFNPECPFCTHQKPLVRSEQDAELVAMVEYACARLGLTYEDLHEECFGDRGFEHPLDEDDDGEDEDDE